MFRAVLNASPPYAKTMCGGRLQLLTSQGNSGTLNVSEAGMVSVARLLVAGLSDVINLARGFQYDVLLGGGALTTQMLASLCRRSTQQRTQVCFLNANERPTEKPNDVTWARLTVICKGCKQSYSTDRRS